MTLPNTVLCVALALAPFGVAHAVRAADTPPPAPEAVRAANPAAPVASTVRDGRITAVSAAGEQVEIDGAWYRCIDGRTRIYRQGRAATMAVLATGQRVSYSAAAGDAKVLGVVYVQ